MSLSELPRALRAYIVAHTALLAPLAWLVASWPGPPSWSLTAVLLVAAAVFSTLKLELAVFHGRITPTFALVCLTLLLQGSQAAVLCAALGAAVGSLVSVRRESWRIRRARQPLYRVGFNVCNHAAAAALGGLCYRWVGFLPLHPDLADLIGLAAFVTCYFLVNSMGVSRAIAWQQGLRWMEVWRENLLWTGVGFAASASASAGLHSLFRMMGFRALPFVLLLGFLFYWHRLYLDRVRLFSENMQQDMTHVKELNRLNQAIIASLANAIDARDHYTSSHIHRVQRYALALARAAGVSGPELQAVETGAIVHDIGKLGVPDRLLVKPGKLTREEFQEIQRHVKLGVDILSPVQFPFPVLDVVLTHHERWDGLGYPRGLRGEQIPITGRIISIVDVFDAITSARPYRRALTAEEGLRALHEGAGKQFDPKLVDLFAAVLPEVRREIEALEVDGPPEPAPRLSPAEAAQESAAARHAADPGAAERAVRAAVRIMALGEAEASRALVEGALELVPADTALYFVHAGGTLRAAAAAGMFAARLDGMSVQLGEGVVGRIAQTATPVLNASAVSDVARRFPHEETLELSAASGVPVWRGGALAGVLVVYTRGYQVLDQAHLHALAVLAGAETCPPGSPGPPWAAAAS